MSDLDKELEQAVAAIDIPAPAARREPASPPPRRKGNLGLLIGVLVMSGAILSLLFFSFDRSQAYAKEVDELVREKGKYLDRSVRVQGKLVKGTLVHRVQEPCEHRFELQNTKGEVVKLPVRYPQCVVPDTFRDMPDMDVMVTAEGKLNSQGYLEASTIFAKCPSKYEMKDMQKNGQKAPHLSQMAQTL